MSVTLPSDDTVHCQTKDLGFCGVRLDFSTASSYGSE